MAFAIFEFVFGRHDFPFEIQSSFFGAHFGQRLLNTVDMY